MQATRQQTLERKRLAGGRAEREVRRGRGGEGKRGGEEEERGGEWRGGEEEEGRGRNGGREGEGRGEREEGFSQGEGCGVPQRAA